MFKEQFLGYKCFLNPFLYTTDFFFVLIDYFCISLFLQVEPRLHQEKQDNRWRRGSFCQIENLLSFWDYCYFFVIKTLNSLTETTSRRLDELRKNGLIRYYTDYLVDGGFHFESAYNDRHYRQ